MKFKLHSPFPPKGDQPKAIASLLEGLQKGYRDQVLLGVTGSGKTFTIANVIQQWGRPTLVISHNKTLAAQLYREFKEFFPQNAVHYFVSFYDYYQPEAYIPQTDTYIEKDCSINDEIDRLRLAATEALMSREDVIVVATVSCIYNIGSPTDFREQVLHIKVGEEFGRERFLHSLVAVQYEREEVEFVHGKFRVRGDVIDVFPPYADEAVRVEFDEDRIERISYIEPICCKRLKELEECKIYPAKHFVTSASKIQKALRTIEHELKERVKELLLEGKEFEAKRLRMRTLYDMEMLEEFGYCHGIENYSRHLDGRLPGQRPWVLLDYFPKDFLLIIDESHVTVPQLRGMYEGDRARKRSLVDYGFRLPSCFDNRPLIFSEFESLMPPCIYVSATPGPYEKEKASQIVEQIIRPTGLVDPPLHVLPTAGFVQDLVARIKERIRRGERVLVTTLTKRMAEDFADYLCTMGLNVRYLHSEIQTLERVKILQDLRAGNFDVLVGINLLREGIDLPEVSLVAILDADKEGFLRSQTSLIQIAGRTARHIDGEVILYADTVTASMQGAIAETERRRKLQIEYNEKHNIKPSSIQKPIKSTFTDEQIMKKSIKVYQKKVEGDVRSLIKELEQQMKEAALRLAFEEAAILRDQILSLKEKLKKKAS